MAERQGEALVDGAGALDEQGDGAIGQRLRRRQPRLGDGQRLDAQHPLGREPKRRLAGDEQAEAGRALVQRLAETGDAGEQVLGVVEREQHRQRRERRDQGRQRLAVTDVHAEGGGEGAGQRIGIGDLGQLDPAHALRIGVATGGEEVLREQRLAETAGADHADQTMPLDQRSQRAQVVVAAVQRRQLDRQVGALRRHLRRRALSRASRQDDDVGRGRVVVRLQRCDEAIAAPRHRRDQVAAEHLAQGADLRREVVLLHHEPGPDDVHQGVLADQLAGPLGQRQQQVEGAAADDCRHAVDEQAPLARLQLEAAEAHRRLRHRAHVATARPAFRRLEKAFSAIS